jgi:hypothetical protein
MALSSEEERDNVWCYIVKERTSIEEKTEENKKGVSSTFH